MTDDLIDHVTVDEEPELPEGTVLVPNSRSGGKRKFHTDPDCQYVTDNHTEWERSMAEEWGLEKCSKCDGEGSFGGYESKDDR